MYTVETVPITQTEKRRRSEYPKYAKSKAGLSRPNSTEASKRSQHMKRVRALMLLGGKCADCGNNDMRVLHLDHVKNDGAESRRKFGRHFGQLQQVFKNPCDFQILCANCHEIKHTKVD